MTKQQAKSLRDCFEAGMSFEEAIGCAGITSPFGEFAASQSWGNWSRAFES